jgi:hypothetical protein
MCPVSKRVAKKGVVEHVLNYGAYLDRKLNLLSNQEVSRFRGAEFLEEVLGQERVHCQNDLDTDMHISCQDLEKSKLVVWRGVLGGLGRS